MSVSRALNSATTGLHTNQTRLDVIGNNIANLNTTSYKSERVNFSTNFSAILNAGTAPGNDMGGTNPLQIGFGAQTASIQTDFTQGSFDLTGRNRDLAIDGNGFFIVKNESGGEVYTRDGTFDISALDTDGESYLVNQKGYRVQGLDANDNLGDIPITMGVSSSAITTQAAYIGNLNDQGDVYVPSTFAGFDLGGGGAIAAGDLLTDVDLQIGGANEFNVGDAFSVSASRGNTSLASAADFIVGAGSTVQDFFDWINAQLNFDTAAGEGAALNATNTGFVLNTAPGREGLSTINLNRNMVASNIDFSDTTTGEVTETPFRFYAALGAPVDCNLAVRKVTDDPAGNRWEWMFEYENNYVDGGTIDYDDNGVIDPADSLATITIPVAPPLTVQMDFSQMSQFVGESEIALGNQDGLPMGQLTDFAVSGDGTITGFYTNGQNEYLGKVQLATFVNPDGLINSGDNLYKEGINSGPAIRLNPMSRDAGQVVGGALEQSNVDLSKQFIDMVISSTGYTANSRVISRQETLLSELINIVR